MKYYSDDQIMKSRMGEVYGMDGGEKRCTQEFSGEMRRIETILKMQEWIEW